MVCSKPAKNRLGPWMDRYNATTPHPSQRERTETPIQPRYKRSTSPNRKRNPLHRERSTINLNRIRYPWNTDDTIRYSARKPHNTSQSHAYGTMQSNSNQEHRLPYPEKSTRCHNSNYRSWPNS